MHKEGYYKGLFFIGALWNWGAAINFLFLTEFTFSLIGMDIALSNTIFFTWFLALVFVYGLGYFWVSRDVLKNHGVVWMGILGKLSLFGLAAYHWSIGLITLPLFMILVGDLIFALLFLEFIVNFTKNQLKR